MTQPSPGGTSDALVADRRDPKAAFNALVDPASPNRILIVHGQPQIGKTYLINHFRGPFWPHIDQVGVDFDREFDNIQQLFDETLLVLGPGRLQAYQAQRRANAGPLAPLVTGAQQFAWNAQINVNVVPDPEGDRRALTEAWFQDVAALERLLVITIDSVETASESERAWMRGVFLPAVARTPSVRVIIAGETPPTPHRSWAGVAATHELARIADGADWMPVLKAKKRKARYEPASDCLDWLCELLDGRPMAIATAIDAFAEDPNA